MGAYDDLVPRKSGGSAYADLIPKPATPAPPSSAWDFLRSIPRGVAEGFASQAMGGDPDVLAAEVGMGHSVDDILATQRGVQTELPAALEKLPLPKPEGLAGRVGRSVGEAIGSPASYVGPGGVPAKLGYAALTGAGAEIGGETAKSLHLPETAGRVVGGVGAALAPRALPSPISAERAADAALLREQGVQPRASDITGSHRLRAAEELGDLPGGGRSFSAGQETVARQYTRALGRRMGLEEETLTPESFVASEARIQAAMEGAAERSSIKVNHGDARLGNGLQAVIQDAFDDGILTEQQIGRLATQVEHINSKFVTGDKASIMSGETYKGITSDKAPLSRLIADKDPNVAYYASRIREELDDALERTAKGRGTREGTGKRQALADLQEARRQYYTMQVLRRSTSDFREAGIEGLIDPQKLRRNLTHDADAATAHAVARLREMGETDLFDIAAAGNRILRAYEKPTSNRAAYTIPGLAAGVGGRVANSAPVQAVASGRVSGAIPEPIREAVRPEAPGGVVAGRAALTEANLPPGWSVREVPNRRKSGTLPPGWSVQQVR